MRDGVTGIPTQALYDAWWSWFDNLTMDAESKAEAFSVWMTAFMDDNTEEFSNWLQAFKDTANTSFYSWYSHFIPQSEEVFREWFDNLQDQLDDNQATNLQNQITQHKNSTMVTPGGVHGLRVHDGRIQVNLGSGWATFAEIALGLRSTYIDALGLTSFQINGLLFTSTQINNLIEMEE